MVYHLSNLSSADRRGKTCPIPAPVSFSPQKPALPAEIPHRIDRASTRCDTMRPQWSGAEFRLSAWADRGRKQCYAVMSGPRELEGRLLDVHVIY